MARNSINAGVAVIEDPETSGSITNIRQVGPRMGVGLDPSLVDGTSGGSRGRGEAVSTIGNLTLTEDGKSKVEGSLEEYSPREYFDNRTITILRGFVGRLEDEGEIDHYSQVLTELAEALDVDDVTRVAYETAEAEIASRGSSELAESVLSFYRDQFRKSFQVVDGYADDRSSERLTDDERTIRLEQERTLLLYSEFLLANIRLNSIHADRQGAGREFLEAGLAPALNDLTISAEQRDALSRAFGALQNYAEFSFTQTCKNVIDHGIEYLPAGDPATASNGGVALDAHFINDVHFVRANDRIEDAHRLMISALDSLNEPARQRWVTERGQNPEIDLIQNSFSTWQEQVEAQIVEREHLDQVRPMESRDYISGILGSRKEEVALWGIRRAHELNHYIKNVDHQAPIKGPGASRDKLETVQATEIAVMAGVWQGEWNQGVTATPGESHPKEFYERVVDVTVWSVSLNSADTVANFIDQLEAADAMQRNGEVVGNVLGNRTNYREFGNAQAYRVPVLNHRGEPSFLVVDKKTYDAMLDVAQTSRESYANLARQDSRYAVHDRETRHAAFRPQLTENRITPEGWVEQERDFILAEEVSRQRVAGLEGGTDADRFVAGQLNESMASYRAQFNEFQLNFCRESRYRELAVSRLTLRGVAGNSPDFDRLLVQEMNAVAVEYINRWNAFRAMTARVLELQNLAANGNLDPESLAIAERDLLNFLANIDYEYEIRVRVASAGGGEGGGGRSQEGQEVQGLFEQQLRQAVQPFMRTVDPPNRDGLLLDQVYTNAVRRLNSNNFLEDLTASSYGLAILMSDNSFLNRTAKGLAKERVATIATIGKATEGDGLLPPIDLGRYDSVETTSVLQGLQALWTRDIGVEDRSTSLVRSRQIGQLDMYNTRIEELRHRLTNALTQTQEGGDLVFPANRENESVAQSLGQARVQLNTLLGRGPTPQEENRFYDGQPELIDRRYSVVNTLERVGQLRTGVREVVNYPARLLNGRQLTELTHQEIVDYACLVYATIRTVNTLPENPEPASVRVTYDRFIDEASGDSVASEYIRRRVHERVEGMRGQTTFRP